MSPVDEKALLQQGIAAARAGDKASARARFRELTAHNFDNELAWLWLASVADTPAHAIACLRRVLQINPAHDKARAALFRVLMEGGIQTARAGDKATAFASFSECATIDPSSELLWTWMASTAPTQAQALDALRRVLHINPSHEQAGRAYKKLVVQRGIDLAQAGDADARVVLLEASAADPENESVWLWLARSVTPEESIEYYERVLELNPSNSIALAALQEMRPQPAITSAPEAPELSDEPDLDLDLPEMFGGNASAGGMVVEQFRGDSAERTQPTMATQAATQEEFLVYQNAESAEVWAPPGTSAAVAEEETVTSFETDSEQDEAGTLDVGAVDEQALEVAVAEMEISVSEQDAMELSLAPPASPNVQLSDVDSYVANAESTYASSARAAGSGSPRFMPPAIEDEDPEVAAAEMALRAMADEQAAAEAAAAEAAAQEAAAQEAAAQEAAALSAAAAVPEPAPAAPALASNEPNTWDCPICLSGAPQSASRCPNCGSVVSLLDPDLLLETEPVDRRHVLQVVARLKSRKVSGSRQQFDHHFTLGLAFVNAGRTTEGLQQLRAASALRKNDGELKAQIDTLERRAAQRAKSASAKPVSAPPAPVTKVNGTATKTPEPRVDLPAAPAPAAEEGGESGSTTYHGTNGNGSRRIILVVDDSPTIQKVVSVTLEAHGHEVVTASDGMEALAKLRTLRPDLVLLDITMPHMDGYQLCRILRSNELTKQVPIVMLSGKDGLFDKMRGRMAGAATYITKPFAPSALPPLVEKYCKRA
jgi:twitching motility two-component system response regulator PilG